MYLNIKRNIFLLFICIAFIAFMSGCADKADTKTSNSIPTATSSQTATETQKVNNSAASNQHGYVLATKTQVAFMQWTEVSKELTGQYQVYNVDANSLKADSATHPFKGMLNSSDISITFSGTVWTDSSSSKTWTGTLKGNNLTLVIPSNDGKLDTVTFTKGTVEDYNQKVTKLQQAISNAQLDRDIANAQAKAKQDQQKTIVNTNENYDNAYYRLLDDTKKLVDSATFVDVVESYGEAWKSIQEVYKEMQDSANVKPFTDYELGNVEYKLSNVEYALGNITYQDSNLDYRKNAIAENIKIVNNDIIALQKAYNTFSKLNKSSADKKVEEYKKIIDSAKNQITASDKKITDAQAVVADYRAKGNNLFEQGKAFVAGLKATSNE